ncbi:glycine zipper 2TM domain-containing protein [Arenimonas oryziterrae]|uniref:Glycine zipper 2TM domain-containing protein n=1 Tax=Arenimonas oryziterrae DSM 21050 = YC6267 TaxID=1121015 RepID=A0A091AUH5_9GAMM|nr:glycine zipper 2TM domain-containing protein [Arenimonas oryziterrae]KFN42882.1 hypothetical protein N789_12190 [Arenimonas oryziterrae DSM 21050 = YC6267]
MTRHKLLVAAIVPALVVMSLSACNRAPAEGAVATAPEAIQQSASNPGVETAQPGEQMAVEPAAPAGPVVEYADVDRVKPVTVKESIFGTVTSVDELTRDSTKPREVCEDVVIQERAPERDGNVGGTVAGAVIGGALGNQVGKGDGRKAATVAGAIAGGVIGRNIDRRSENGKIVSRTEQQCHTEEETVSTVTGYQVRYRKSNGSTGSQRMEDRPSIGSRINLGSTSKTVGYDVTYTYAGKQSTVRMDSKPGDQLQVIDGQVVTGTAPVSQR